jgi:hypothetical protein
VDTTRWIRSPVPDPAEMQRATDAYCRTLGKTSANFKAVIPLTYMIGSAKTLPRVVVA